MNNVHHLPTRIAPPSEPLLSKSQLAARYARSERWVEGLISHGLPCVFVGNARRFRLSEVHQHLVKQGIIRDGTVKESA